MIMATPAISQLDKNLLRQVYLGDYDTIDDEDVDRLQTLGLLDVIGEEQYVLSPEGERILEGMGL